MLQDLLGHKRSLFVLENLSLGRPLLERREKWRTPFSSLPTFHNAGYPRGRWRRPAYNESLRRARAAPTFCFAMVSVEVEPIEYIAPVPYSPGLDNRLLSGWGLYSSYIMMCRFWIAL